MSWRKEKLPTTKIETTKFLNPYVGFLGKDNARGVRTAGMFLFFAILYIAVPNV